MVLAWAVACVLIVCLQCIPLRGYWDKSVPAKCGVNEKDYFLGKSIPDTVTDLFILVIPMHPIWHLHVNRMQKLVLTLTFLIGGLVTVISIIRLVCLLEIDLSSEDITWNFVPYLIWTCVELNVGIVAACLPCLRPIYIWLRKKAGYSTGSSGSERPTPGTNRKSSRSGWSGRDEYGDQVPMHGIKFRQDFLVQTTTASDRGDEEAAEVLH
ncbi:hypothetical protein BO94DRAFT_540919 [Aspergillus sclerotioniger CBS 115572]|uniref:Rhodopsin domain-containing protein n=1 Tax=Aspergillus sclerotioniger CBS 115572 TaxID=1450535 RepID=A0A317UUC4_9EURO|nr:hypothetical protein BO94DRAFT_540919 [Aspergillus sclerotioniger CBS 115572]PWY64969.1 hypothetical protein BO94DRAFT_540919 [Aspergillus sclerotioniger CBS 115572]